MQAACPIAVRRRKIAAMVGKLQVIAPDPKVHHDELIDLIAKVFSHSGYFDFRDWLRGGYLDGSHYDWRASRIGMLDGRIVSHFGVWDYPMRIGAARVRCGGIGVVATHFDYRKRGVMARTAQASIRAMRQLGYDVSILFGIGNFYRRFGYTRAFSDEDYTLNLGELPKGPPVGLEKFAAGPRADLARLYNRQYAAATGTAVRPTYRAPDKRKERLGVLWRKGPAPAGYLLYCDRGERIDIIETVGRADEALHAAGAVARKCGADKVRFSCLPYGTDLAANLRRMSCALERRYVRCGGAMIRTINLPQSLAKMSGELSRRLGRSELRGWRGGLVIADRNESATLAIRDGAVAVRPGTTRTPHAIRGGDAVAQLLIGTDEPLETARSCGIRLLGEARRLLPALFPNEHPMLHLADRY
jgi:GNAT superfamily N-acetyltransferase